jgi:Ni2+-binding GTPase involved in maturation of urease and hydrogenase
MRIRLGLDNGGNEINIDTATRARVGLLGPPGCGKTTTCRYIARRWLATRNGPCCVLTSRPYEYADLDVAIITDPRLVTVPSGSSLLIVDEADQFAASNLERAVRSDYQLVIVASFGDAVTRLTSDETPAVDTVYAIEHGLRILGQPVQCRLDWPPHTIPVFLGARAHTDFPVHRWAM